LTNHGNPFIIPITMESQKIWATLDPFHEGGAIMGRSVANEALLRALLALDPCDEYHFFLRDRKLVQSVDAFLACEFPAIHGAGRFAVRTREALPGALASTPYHCFHLSDCINFPAHLARLRNALAPQIFPITGTTHSLSYTRYMTDFLAHMWKGTTARDCVVATSSGAAQVVGSIYDHLSEQYGPLPRPRVERIPLGVDTEALRPPTPQERTAARAQFGLVDGELAVLVFARISHFSKMDLVPVLRVVRRMDRQCAVPGGVRLLVAGWTEEGDSYPETLVNLATNAGVHLDVVPRPDEQAKCALYHAADVFLSPVDNPQETFGLTVLEAAAAGLPAVVSDYDGYRDLVLHNETGLLVPTIGPDGTVDVDSLAPLMYDHEYHLLLAQQTVVDVGACARALGSLAADPARRARLGRAARARAEAGFSWRLVAEKYAALWDRLWAEPVDAEALRGYVHPLHMPYARIFGGYPSRVFGPDLVLSWTPSGEAVYRDQDFITIYDDIESRVDPETVKRTVFFARKPVAADELLRKLMAVCGLGLEQARFLILWALKHDLLERADDGIGS